VEWVDGFSFHAPAFRGALFNPATGHWKNKFFQFHRLAGGWTISLSLRQILTNRTLSISRR
jgi:hypothetical protein